MATILVIEDEAPIRENLRTFLEMEDHAVIEAGDGQAGLALARLHVPDLVLCDLRLPELDGCALLEALRSQPATAEIPVVLLSASADLFTRERIQASGFAAFLTKPFDLGDLRAAIARNLRRR